MSFPRYPNYKDSGVEWLGEVPGHWGIPPLYLRYEVVLGKMLNEKRLTRTNLVPYLRNVDVHWDRVNVDDLPEMDIALDEFERFTLKRGDLLVCEGGEVGRTATWNGDLGRCAFQKAIHRLRPQSDGESPRFLYYCMLFAASAGVFVAEGNPNTISHLTGEKLRRYRFPSPSLPEQTAVAAFLDRETAKIDALVVEQRRLCDLLREKVFLLALSSAHLLEGRTMRLRDAATIASRPVVQRAGELYTPVGLLNWGRGLFHKDARDIDEMGDSDFFWIEDGDFIISGQFAWEGAVALAGPSDAGCVASHRYHILRGRSGITLTEYLLALFSTTHGTFLLNQHSRGAAGRNRPLNTDSLMKEYIPVPDMRIQERVAEAVHSKNSAFRESSVAIDLLQERRTALISAAVTGQIDVRSASERTAA